MSEPHPRPAILSHRDLHVWRIALDLALLCYDITDRFPNAERFGLTQQIRRCAASVPSNIAEGHGRGYTGDYLRFLWIANGSLSELDTQIEIASRRGYLTSKDHDLTLERMRELGRMITGLRRRLLARLRHPAPHVPSP